MKEVTKVVKFLIKDTFRLRKNEKSSNRIVMYLLFGVLYLFMEFSIISTISSLAPLFADAQLISEFLTFIMVSGLVFVTAIGIMPMLNLLYFSKDAEFFLSLPISSSKVYFAKLATVYLAQFLLTAALILPPLYAVGFVVKLSWVFFITTIFALVLLPIFPLLIISIICLPLMYLMRFFKNRGAMASVVTLILFVVFFVGYMILIGGSNAMPDDETQIVEMFSGMVKNVANTFLPILAINRFSNLENLGNYGKPISMLLNFFIFVVPALLLFVITLIISRKAYSRAVSSQLENLKHSSSGSMYQTPSTAQHALISKEFKSIIRTPVFTIQCFMGLIIAPITFLIIGIGGGEVETADTSVVFMWLLFVMLIHIIVISLNLGAATSFSRDGESFYLNKLLPVSYEKIIKSKALFYNIVYDADILLCALILFIIIGFSFWWVGLLCTLYLIILNYATINIFLMLDLSKPNLEWKSYREVVKNSRNAVLPTIISEFASIVLSVLAIVGFELLSMAVGEKLGAALVTVILTVAASAFAFISHNILMGRAEKYFERIEC